MSTKRIKHQILLFSRESNLDPQVVFKHYMVERFLERVSLSDFKQSIILKGGILIASMIGIQQRSTIDMDATVYHQPLSMQKLKLMLDSILSIEINDGVRFKTIKMQEINHHRKYQGFRIYLEAILDGSTIPIHVDLTTGDVITPGKKNFQYALMMEDRKIELVVYPIETVIAEKLESILVLGTSNSRMKDFYDLFMLFHLNKGLYEPSLLAKAFWATTENRGTTAKMLDSELTISDIFTNKVMEERWQSYKRIHFYASDIVWGSIKDPLMSFLKIIMQSV